MFMLFGAAVRENVADAKLRLLQTGSTLTVITSNNETALLRFKRNDFN